MSMYSANRQVRRVWLSALMTLTAFVVTTDPHDLFAQQKAHYLFNARQPVGEIGRRQVAIRPELLGVFQPVLLKVPKGTKISVAEGTGFSVAELDAVLVSLQMGETYRLKITSVPNHYGDVYPTVELLDRMHAPIGKETRYPIPIELTSGDLGLALSGKYVTRVIYVEDPQRALPSRDLPEQRYSDVLGHEDPLHVADSIGRPVAILRMGSLTPGRDGPDTGFLFGSPPSLRHIVAPAASYNPSELEAIDLPRGPAPREESTKIPPVAEDQVEAGKAGTTEPIAPAEPRDEALPNDRRDGTGDLIEESATPASDDIFDQPIDTPDDNLGEEDPIVDDI